MKTLSKAQLTRIAAAIFAEHGVFDSTPFRHLKPTVRQMMLEAMQAALAAAQDDNQPNERHPGGSRP